MHANVQRRVAVWKDAASCSDYLAPSAPPRRRGPKHRRRRAPCACPATSSIDEREFDPAKKRSGGSGSTSARTRARSRGAMRGVTGQRVWGGYAASTGAVASRRPLIDRSPMDWRCARAGTPGNPSRGANDALSTAAAATVFTTASSGRLRCYGEGPREGRVFTHRLPSLVPLLRASCLRTRATISNWSTEQRQPCIR